MPRDIDFTVEPPARQRFHGMAIIMSDCNDAWMAGGAGRGLTLLTVVVWKAEQRAGFFETDPAQFCSAHGRHRSVGVLCFFSATGLRCAMVPFTSATLADREFRALKFNSPTLFVEHRSAGEMDTIIANAERQMLARTGGDHLVRIGQPLGSNILQTKLTRREGASAFS